MSQTSLLVFGACDVGGPRVYTARAYRADEDCLEPYAPVGLVEADELGSACDAVCLRIGGQLYVSTVCRPYPTEAALETPDEASECQLALEKLASETECDGDVEPDM
jgi:hypothetical protein